MRVRTDTILKVSDIALMNQQGRSKMKCNDCDEKAIIDIDNMHFCEECADEYEQEK